MHKVSLRSIGLTMILMKVILLLVILWQILPSMESGMPVVDHRFLWFVAVGLVAQTIDGALGMAYGVSCTTFLLQIGVPPRVASASVHAAEVFTTGVSGLAHLKFRNLDKPLFFLLVFPGSIGAILGAWLLADGFQGDWVRTAISAYLLVMGISILRKGWQSSPEAKGDANRHAGWLGFFGGFFDAIGGGGWGPIVTSHMLHRGSDPRTTIGTVNTAEFFVTFFSTGVFLWFLGIESWPIVAGLVLGGVLGAPLGAWSAAHLNRRTMLLATGLTVSLLSLVGLFGAFFR